MEKFDLIVIGAGAGGLTAVDFARKLGAKVALVEKHRVGGDCTWTGCVPSKALLHAASVAQTVRQAALVGISTGAIQVDMAQVRDYVKSCITAVYRQESPETLRRDGVDVALGGAQFLDGHTIQAGGRTLTAPRVIIATGAHPLTPPIPGLEAVDFHTHATIFENGRLPQHLLVLGAGPVGVEIGQAYGRLGARVTLVDEVILPGVDREAAAILSGQLTADGVNFTAGLATAVTQQGQQISVQVNDQTITGDLLLVATGRRPNVAGLGLEQAGVDFSESGITTDRFLRTSQKHIYAVGDCTGGFQFSHYAGWQAFTAVRNALLPGQDKGVLPTVPWAVFTAPEIGQAGLSETAARLQFGESVQTSLMPLTQVDRAITANQTGGFIKLIHRPNGKLLGATIVAANAGELIAEFVLALHQGLKLRDVAETLHVYPTLGTGAQMLAMDWATHDFLDSAMGRIALRLAGLDGAGALPNITPNPQLKT
ncbi:MAG: dihydrolipoyl dehydrogenase family protein [Anaerolineae bacterium]